MSKIDSDIDIDVPDRVAALRAINRHCKASIINDGVIKPHNVGIYLQEIPEFLSHGISSIDYKEAPKYGFYKLDILTNTVYDDVKSEDHLDLLLNTVPDWNLLQDSNIVKTLFQIHRYDTLLKRWRPNSVLQLAMFIAMIRPSKKHLMDLDGWDKVEETIWLPPEDGTQYFKKSHAIAYASAIVIQLNLLSGL